MGELFFKESSFLAVMNRLFKYLSISILVGLAAFGLKTWLANPPEAQPLDQWAEQHRADFQADGEIVFGIVSDIEGHTANAAAATRIFESSALDAIIVAGDTYENEALRRNPLFPASQDNVQELVAGLRPFAQLGVPLFVVQGNHEETAIYQEALQQLQEVNSAVFDISDATLDFSGVNIVGLGGYHNPRFLPRSGRLLQEEDYARAAASLRSLQEQNEPTFFVTHGPPQATSLIDYVPNVGHVGDENLTQILSSDLRNIVHLHGHIHEGGGNEERFPAGVSINVASITSYSNPSPRADLCRVQEREVSCSPLILEE